MNFLKQNIISTLRGIRSLSKTHVFIIFFTAVAGMKLCYDRLLEKESFSREKEEELFSFVGERLPWQSYEFRKSGFIALDHDDMKIVFGKDFYESLLKEKKDYLRFFLLHEKSHIPQVLWVSFLIFLVALLSKPHHLLEKRRLYVFLFSLIIGMGMESNADISACEELKSTETCLSAMNFLDQKLSHSDRVFTLVNFNPHPPIFIRKLLIQHFSK